MLVLVCLNSCRHVRRTHLAAAAIPAGRHDIGVFSIDMSLQVMVQLPSTCLFAGSGFSSAPVSLLHRFVLVAIEQGVLDNVKTPSSLLQAYVASGKL